MVKRLVVEGRGEVTGMGQATGINFFFKQKTAYEMRISDWSSDVCSSDLPVAHWRAFRLGILLIGSPQSGQARPSGDRKSVGLGKSVSVRVDLGGGRNIKIKYTRRHDDRTSCKANNVFHKTRVVSSMYKH